MIPAILLTDCYKLDHRRQYPEGTTEVYSNFTARQSRVDGIDEVVFFGLRYYVQRYLIEEFDIWFDMDEDEAVREYEDMVKAYLGPDALGGDFSHIRDLHRLQCLPIRLKALPEGSKVKIGVPVLTIVNTLPQFFWVTNYLETCLSNTLWLPITSATTALQYRGILDRAYKGRDSNEWFKDWQCHDFSYRGMSSLESACLSGAAHLLSFKGTDTVPAVSFLKKYYSIQDDTVIAGSVAATEHSVMMASGDDKETFTRLLTDVYPKGIVSVVSDTWDLWHVVGNILPSIKDLIMSREGKVVIRPDSGSPLLILCGDEKGETELERKGLIEALWDIFGGTVNDEGYKVLDPHIGAIYGDSITPERAKSILFFLKRKGFSPINVVFGVGSFSYQYATRDTFGLIASPLS